ncbi:MAG: hypothetical protein ACK4LQ_06545 [Pararhodobacter sp.]
MPLKSVLLNAAREIERLSELAREIDEAVGTVSLSGAQIPLSQAQTLQRVDLLRQSLECMTEFIGQVAQQSNEGANICADAAVRNIPLRDLARNLVAGPVGAAGGAAADGGQETLFF